MQPAPLCGPVLLERFHALDRFLLEHQALWRPRPFTHQQLPWEASHPALAAWLRERSLSDAEAAHNDPAELGAPAPYPDLADQARRLSRIGALPLNLQPHSHPQMSVDVPGRKWQQIEAFAASLHFRQTPQHWLDWCAGKGHLGRLLAHQGQPLTCLELDPQLVLAGQHLSQRLALPVMHYQQDVLADDADRHLQPEHTPIALHACGDLHVRLLQVASRVGCAQLAVAPCCYNRIAARHYQPLSNAAQQSTLQLSKDDLALPLSETVTAGARVRRQRDQSMAWRLAFDLLQREVRGLNHYLPTPSLPSAWLTKPFATYCQDLASQQGLPALPTQDWPQLEAHGWQRLAAVRNLELVRGLFRRPLELWLVLDRALYLEQQGYAVTLGTFCAAQLTPRNLLLLAERQ